MRFVASGTGMQNLDEGFLLRRPDGSEHTGTFDSAVAALPGVEVTERGPLVRVQQRDGVDLEDRVEVGANLISRLVGPGP